MPPFPASTSIATFLSSQFQLLNPEIPQFWPTFHIHRQPHLWVSTNCVVQEVIPPQDHQTITPQRMEEEDPVLPPEGQQVLVPLSQTKNIQLSMRRTMMNIERVVTPQKLAWRWCRYCCSFFFYTTFFFGCHKREEGEQEAVEGKWVGNLNGVRRKGTHSNVTTTSLMSKPPLQTAGKICTHPNSKQA